MNGGVAQLFLLAGAFWTAVVLYRGHRPWRFVAGLGFGAVLAHLGWALLNLDAVRHHPAALLDPTLGFCVLFLPLGLVVFEPSAAAWRTLTLALAVARAGCLAAGCCDGAEAMAVPVPVAEIAGFVVLHVALARLDDARVLSGFVIGFGAIRLLLDPLRAAPPLGEPGVPVAVLAVTWIVAGGCVAAVRSAGDRAMTIVPIREES